jgi:Tfp pilus assembly protein PilF
VAPRVAVLWTNLVAAQVFQARFAAADSSLERWRAAAPEAVVRFAAAYDAAFARGEYHQAWDWADSLSQAEPLSQRSQAASMKARLGTLTGRLADAGRHFAESVELNRQRGSVRPFFGAASGWFGLDYWLRDDPERARKKMDSLLARHPIDSLAPTDRPYLQLAIFYARTGDARRAEGYYRAWRQEVPEVVRVGDTPGSPPRG